MKFKPHNYYGNDSRNSTLSYKNSRINFGGGLEMFRGEIITTTQQLHHYFGTNKYIEENNNNGRLSERGSVDVVIEVVVLWFYLRTARRSPGGRHKTSTFSFFLFYDLGYYSFKMSFWGSCPQQQLPSLVTPSIRRVYKKLSTKK